MSIFCILKYFFQGCQTSHFVTKFHDFGESFNKGKQIGNKNDIKNKTLAILYFWNLATLIFFSSTFIWNRVRNDSRFRSESIRKKIRQTFKDYCTNALKPIILDYIALLIYSICWWFWIIFYIRSLKTKIRSNMKKNKCKFLAVQQLKPQMFRIVQKICYYKMTSFLDIDEHLGLILDHKTSLQCKTFPPN